ncbi:pentatricopeptide repeat-containing protein [Trifolium medium]|uniref:Pentatricopeptide repeat-containing protein n=1 Tax=Trifolium medium TaxID=97028 RepID=A0A392PH18_9FABA|nr:pentatricopeptide repeat-containing protein [Trifolium medium]
MFFFVFISDFALNFHSFHSNSLINGWCKVKDVDKAMCLLNEMVNEGLYPDAVTFTTLVGGFCEVGKPFAAKELFFMMKEYGMVPNLLTRAVVLDGLDFDICDMKYVRISLFHMIVHLLIGFDFYCKSSVFRNPYCFLQ